jgi:hypothetical protein
MKRRRPAVEDREHLKSLDGMEGDDASGGHERETSEDHEAGLFGPKPRTPPGNP